MESHLRSLYSRAVVQHKQRQPQLASSLYLALLSHPVYRALNRGDPSAASDLSRGLLHAHFLSLKGVAGLCEEAGDDASALQCYAFTSISAPTGAASFDALLPVRLALARCALRAGQLDMARTVLEEAMGRAADDWEVIDLLLDVLYCIGDRHALLALARFALQRDKRSVKALLLHAQLHALRPARASFHAHCMRELQRAPFAAVQSVTNELRALASSVQGAALSGEPLPNHEVVVAPASADAVALALLRVHAEIAALRRARKKPNTAPSTFSSLHGLLRALKGRQSGVAAEGANPQPGPQPSLSSTSPSSSLSLPSTPSGALSLTTPIILSLRSGAALPASPAKAVAQSDPTVSVVEEEEEPIEPSTEHDELQQRRQACALYLRTGLPESTELDDVTFAFNYPSLPSLPATASGVIVSVPATVPASPLEQPDTFCEDVFDFVAEHAASADCNDGVVDVMQRLLRWVRFSGQRSVRPELLSQLVLAVSEHREQHSDDGDDLLFSAEVLLDSINPSSPPSPTVLSALSARLSSLSLLTIASPAALSPTECIRLAFLGAHHSILLSDSPGALSGLQRCLELLSASSLPSVSIPHSRHPILSAGALHAQVARLSASHLTQQLSSLSALSDHASVLSLFASAPRDPILALASAPRRTLLDVVWDSARHLNDHAASWQVAALGVRGWALEAADAVRAKGSITRVRQGAAEAIEQLHGVLAEGGEAAQWTTVDVMGLMRDVCVCASLVAYRVIHDGLVQSLIRVYDRLALIHHRLSNPSVDSAVSAFHVHLNLVSTSHGLLAVLDECQTVGGRSLLSSYLESLFEGPHLRLHEQHTLPTLLSLLPPLPPCFMPETPPPSPSSTFSESPTASPSSARRPSSLILAEVSQLLSDLCDMYKDVYPAHGAESTSASARCVQFRDQLLLSPLQCQRLLHVIVAHLLHFHASHSLHCVSTPMRNALLSSLELLSPKFPHPSLEALSAPFIVPYLMHGGQGGVREVVALVPSVGAVWGDEASRGFWQLYAQYVLPAYVQRVNEADDWYSNASYRREWEKEQALIHQLTTLSLSACPSSAYLWYSLGLLHWEPAQREIYSKYAELNLDPLEATRHMNAQSYAFQQGQQRSTAKGWVLDYTKGTASSSTPSARHGCVPRSLLTLSRYTRVVLHRSQYVPR